MLRNRGSFKPRHAHVHTLSHAHAHARTHTNAPQTHTHTPTPPPVLSHKPQIRWDQSRSSKHAHSPTYAHTHTHTLSLTRGARVHTHTHTHTFNIFWEASKRVRKIARESEIERERLTRNDIFHIRDTPIWHAKPTITCPSEERKKRYEREERRCVYVCRCE